ncbi:MAG: hypothetical protein DRP12_00475 [Candidatus Aenigmatarchaeota archaeon]|nr:MAG: hypothetical protein DRP12_00475 [Candidatus Aenigmarchaeota archaeon]
MPKFIDGKMAYEAILLKPKDIPVVASEVSRRILKELAKEPGCAMDIARRLGIHEQKVYYHFRKLIEAGVIKEIGREKRANFTARIYTIAYPVLASKIAELGRPIAFEPTADLHAERLFEPFIVGGKLNCLLVLGDPYPHGRFEASARHGVHVTDFALFLGGMLLKLEKVNYKLDTQVTQEDLQRNLILLGGPKVNIIADKLNPHLPIYFEPEKDWRIVSRLTGKTYHGDLDAIVLKIKNPFNPKAWLMLLAGRRSIGLRTAVLACIQNAAEILKGNKARPEVIAKVVTGADRDGDGIIDTIKILE